MPLLNGSFGFTWRSAEQVVKSPVCHSKTAQEREAFQIQPERSVRPQIDQIVVDCLDETGLPIRRQAHQFIFARVDPEPAVGGKCGIEQPERMRKPKLFEHFDLANSPAT